MLLHEEMQGVNTAVSVSKFFKLTSRKRRKRRTEMENGKRTGLEWTGLTQNSVKCLFQCRTEAKHMHIL